MIKGMSVSNKGSKLTLVLGLTLGLVAAVLTFVYLSSADSGGSSSIKSSGGNADTPVVVVNSDIPAGTRITAEMVTVKNVAAADAILGALNTTEGVVNQVTTVNLVKGEQVLASRVTGSGDVEKFGENPPLSLLLKPGMRGISVEVSSLIGAGGLIRPGDRVDVILSVKTQATEGEAGGRENQIAATILQNVEVVAIGQTVSSAATAQTGEEGAIEDPVSDATTVTLAATPIQSEVLALADVCKQNFDGRVSLAVRGAGDAERFAPRSEWPADGRTPDCLSLLGISVN